MKRRFLAGQVMAAAVLAAGLSPAIASAQGTGGAPSIPLLVTGDTGSFFTLDASKDTEVGNIYGAMESLVTLSPTGRVEPSFSRVGDDAELDHIRLPPATGSQVLGRGPDDLGGCPQRP